MHKNLNPTPIKINYTYSSIARFNISIHCAPLFECNYWAKGCGKSVVLAVLFYILGPDNCLYLTKHSYNCIALVRHLYGESKKTEDDIVDAMRLAKKKQYVLIDFGSYPTDLRALKFLTSISNSRMISSKIVALSSGYHICSISSKFSREVRYAYIEISKMVNRAFNKVALTGFTNEEAAKFIDEKKDMRKHKDKVLEIGGTNPLLLSLCDGCTDDFTVYAHRVDIKVKAFLKNNLTIFKDVDGILLHHQ